ncbi:MAG: glycosyltransferase family 4 protein [Planctomycetales bacterium]|nr:glycosyltransferase family 4 protein [Planctomycetales bacterium]
MSRTDNVPRFLVLVPGAFARAGGIEAFDRLVIKAASEHCRDRGGETCVLSLNDTDGSVDTRYLAPRSTRYRGFGRSKWRFAREAILAACRFRPTGIMVGHVHLAPLAAGLRLVSRAWQWYFLYGIEVWRRLTPIQRLALRRADIVSAISGFTRDVCARCNCSAASRIHVLACALDPFWPGSTDLRGGEPLGTGSRTLLTVARLAASERYKGVDDVLRAMPDVLRAIPGANYVIVGEGDDRGRLEGIARALGIADHVQFRGWLAPPSLAEAYSQAALFVMPSRKEGFGIVYLEAAAHGCPSVAAAEGGSSEFIADGESGRLVPYGEPRALAACLISLLSDDRRRAEMGRRARERLREGYTYEAFRRRFDSILDNGVSAAPCGASGHRTRRIEPTGDVSSPTRGPTGENSAARISDG